MIEGADYLVENVVGGEHRELRLPKRAKSSIGTAKDDLVFLLFLFFDTDALVV